MVWRSMIVATPNILRTKITKPSLFRSSWDPAMGICPIYWTLSNETVLLCQGNHPQKKPCYPMYWTPAGSIYATLMKIHCSSSHQNSCRMAAFSGAAFYGTCRRSKYCFSYFYLLSGNIFDFILKLIQQWTSRMESINCSRAYFYLSLHWFCFLWFWFLEDIAANLL